MTKLKVVVLLAVVALLLFPAMAFAETPPEIPCVFHGTVTVDGVDVADGTTIEAYIGGAKVAETTTPAVYGSSTYQMKIIQPEGASYDGAAVTFKIGVQSAKETGTWVRGKNFETDLTSGIPGPGPVDGGGITSVVVEYIEPGESQDPDYNATTGVLTLYIPKGEKGDPGEDGEDGAPGEDAAGGIALPVVALVIAIIAAGMAAMGMRRKV